MKEKKQRHIVYDKQRGTKEYRPSKHNQKNPEIHRVADKAIEADNHEVRRRTPRRQGAYPRVIKIPNAPHNDNRSHPEYQYSWYENLIAPRISVTDEYWNKERKDPREHKKSDRGPDKEIIAKHPTKPRVENVKH